MWEIHEVQGDIVPVNAVSVNRDWIRWVRNNQQPRMSRLKCYPCAMMKPYNKLRSNEYSEMASEHGILYPTKGENLKAIKRHAASKGHERVREDIQKYNLGEVIGSLADLIAKKGTNPMNEATNNVVKSVFYEIGVHNSLNSHQQTMEFLQSFRKDDGTPAINVGKSHCHSRAAARNFVVAMGERYHLNFLEGLNEDKPLTLSMLITTNLKY